MARYIDADNLLEKLHRMIDYCEKDRKVNAVGALFQVGDAIMDCETADVVEVVRCKDCAVPHNQWTGCPKLNGLVTPPDFYCSRAKGEKKMTRYIDADKLCELARNSIDKKVDANDIMRFPISDVQEVRYCKFELVQDGKGVCSNCHRLDSIDKLAKYCRYCGASIKWEDDSNG